MRRSATLAAVLFIAVSPCVAGDGAAAHAESSGMAKMAEALIAKLPTEKIDRAAGFFGPVVKKYQPDMWAFQEEYAASENKGAVIIKYMPRLEVAFTDAKAMSVPARYEKEKAEYIRIASSVMTSLSSGRNVSRTICQTWEISSK